VRHFASVILFRNRIKSFVYFFLKFRIYQSISSMKKLLALLLSFVISVTVFAQTQKDKEIISESKEAKQSFLKTDKGMDKFFSSCHGYVIFPNVGKGGLGVGGASGNGAVFQKGSLIGMAKLTQISIGFQAGGQSFREVIFFQTQKAFDRFKDNKVEFAAQVSAVAAASGVSADAKYVDGVAVFTMAKGGLMYQASIGGQKFKFDPF
jgi:lipid-binding SYLF domain-containing protein